MESIVNIESRSPMDNGQVFLRLDGHVGTTTWLAGGCFQKKELKHKFDHELSTINILNLVQKPYRPYSSIIVDLVGG